MNILFLFVDLQDLSNSTGFGDLIKEFVKNGHNVKIAAPKNKNSSEGLNTENGIEVLRYHTDQLTRNSSNVQKGFAYLKYIYQVLFAIRKYYNNEKFDLIISHSLPPELGIVSRILKRKYKAKFYLMLCEYIWQDSVSLGLFKKGGLICKYYQWLERMTIRAADYIGSPSQGNIDFVLKYYPWVKNKNIRILHYSRLPIELIKTEEDPRVKFNLEDKFVAIFGGNITIAQKIENIIDLAESCMPYNDILFLIIGRGPKLNEVKNDVKFRNITNIRFIEFMPKEEYDTILATCDVGIISLNENLGIPNIPSKTLSYFNLSVPIIASIDHVTDYGKYLENAVAGLWSFGGDTAAFKENLLKLYHSPELRKKMGENGYNFYLNNMLPEKGYNTIMDQIK